MSFQAEVTLNDGMLFQGEVDLVSETATAIFLRVPGIGPFSSSEYYIPWTSIRLIKVVG